MSVQLEDRGRRWAPALAAMLLQSLFVGLCCLRQGAVAPEAFERHVPDDTYYYLQVAWNVAAGAGSCFSVGEPTNGYHPLWPLVLAGAQWL